MVTEVSTPPKIVTEERPYSGITDEAKVEYARQIKDRTRMDLATPGQIVGTRLSGDGLFLEVGVETRTFIGNHRQVIPFQLPLPEGSMEEVKGEVVKQPLERVPHG